MDWLPDELQLASGSLEEDYKKLYKVFENDFIKSKIYYNGERVIYQKAIDHKTPGEYPHGFTHLITRKNGNQRIIDYDRAVRLPWVKAVIEHADDPAVVILTVQRYAKNNGLTDNTYLWLEEKKFLIILSRINHGKNRGQMIITAYTITENYVIKKLEDIRRKLLN